MINLNLHDGDTPLSTPELCLASRTPRPRSDDGGEINISDWHLLVVDIVIQKQSAKNSKENSQRVSGSFSPPTWSTCFKEVAMHARATHFFNAATLIVKLPISMQECVFTFFSSFYVALSKHSESTFKHIFIIIIK